MSYRIHVIGKARPERKRQRPYIDRKGRPMAGPRTDEPDRADWKAWIKLCASQVCSAPLEGPLYLDIIVCKPRPTSYPKRPTARFPWPRHWTKKPDVTNFAKLIEDALTGIAWHDDAQIVDGATHKRFGPRDEVIITVAEQESLGWQAPQSVRDTWDEWVSSREEAGGSE